jgi:uncharacterized protein (TIGR02231 family)
MPRMIEIVRRILFAIRLNRAAQLCLGVPLIGLILIGPLRAEQIEVASKIDQVTVYPDSALVRRSLTLDLPAGEHALIVPDLPFLLDQASLRVEAHAGARVILGGVDLKLMPKGAKAQQANAQKLKALRLEFDRITDKIDALEGRKAMIQAMGQAGPETKGKGPVGAGIELENWIKAWDIVGKALDQANSELRFFRIEEARVNDEIAALEAAGTGDPDHQPQRAASVAVTAMKAGPVTLHLTYRVSGASWRPIYDARLITSGAKPELELTSRAMIRQNTGEDWKEASLTLSTLSVRRGTAAPDLMPERAGLWVPPPVGMPTPTAKTTVEPAVMPKQRALITEHQRAARAQPDESIPSEESSAALLVRGFHAEFLVPGKVSLHADGTERSLRLGSQLIEPVLSIKASPVLDSAAYLEASFTAPGEAPLLPGEVLLTRDGSFVGKTRLKLLVKGEKANLGFGVDDQVKITRVPLAREVREAGFLGNTRSEERSFKTNVKNFHTFPIDLLLQDRIPISEEQGVIVERLPEMTKPDLETLDDKRGVFAYSFRLKPGEERNFVTAYRIRWPQDKEMRITPLPR